MELAEQGLIANLIVKDHSRLGRNRLIVGQLLEEEFDRLGIRYIAIMDNIDTAKGLSDIVPMQDLFNEWHAKNTSQKGAQCFQEQGNGRHTAYHQSTFRVYEKSRKQRRMDCGRACRKGGKTNLWDVCFRLRTDADSKTASFWKSAYAYGILETVSAENAVNRPPFHIIGVRQQLQIFLINKSIAVILSTSVPQANPSS